MTLSGIHGYDIICDAYRLEGAGKVIVDMHGFAGDRKSSYIAALKEQLIRPGIGLIAFDWKVIF